MKNWDGWSDEDIRSAAIRIARANGDAVQVALQATSRLLKMREGYESRIAELERQNAKLQDELNEFTEFSVHEAESAYAQGKRDGNGEAQT